MNRCALAPELWKDGLQSRKNKKKDPLSPGKKKKKPVVVSDILYKVASAAHLKSSASVFLCV